jgi:hypothetical protein
MYARWKMLLSYRKRDWELRDYPVWIRKQDSTPVPADSRFKSVAFWASIINWHISGFGDTPADAIQDLGKAFNRIKMEKLLAGEPLHRPGRDVPIKFASQDRIEAHAELAEEFVQKVLGHDWAWISDESSLWDFHTEETNHALFQEIQRVYGVDVSDIESAKIWEILDRISSSR